MILNTCEGSHEASVYYVSSAYPDDIIMADPYEISGSYITPAAFINLFSSQFGSVRSENLNHGNIVCYIIKAQMSPGYKGAFKNEVISGIPSHKERRSITGNIQNTHVLLRSIINYWNNLGSLRCVQRKMRKQKSCIANVSIQDFRTQYLKFAQNEWYLIIQFYRI